MIKALAFDMDGTLLDSDALIIQSFAAVFSQYAPHIPYTPELQATLTAPSYHEVFMTHFPGIDEALLLQTYLSVQERGRATHLRLFPGAADMLAALKHHGFPLALITSEYRSIALEELHLMGIDHYFDLIVCGDDVEHPKPHPEPVERVLREFRLAPYELLFIGDQRTDFEAARASRVRSGAVAWSPLGIDLLRSYRPMVIIQDLADVLPYVQAHNEHQLQGAPATFSLRLSHNDHARILQFTDLHLMATRQDDDTYRWMAMATRVNHPDLIVITGDLTMHPESVRLYYELGQFMETLGVPWTFIFGNHDIEGATSYDQLVHQVRPCSHLIFDSGPEGVKGVGNFTIRLESQDGSPLHHLLFLDSGVDYMYPEQGQLRWGYDVVETSQIDWVERVLLASPELAHSVFLHIPLLEYHAYSNIPLEQRQGDFIEGPSTAPFNTGLFDVLLDHGWVQGVFCGHDHYNDFSFKHRGILLAYGRVSGHYDYGAPNFPKGARVIDCLPNGDINSFLIYEHDYGLPMS